MNSPNPEPGLLRDIAERPDDDDPRLILADWLEEHAESGDTRADLIRVQFALDSLPPDHPERPALLARERVLVEQEECRWYALFAIHGVDVDDVDGIVFERGFPKHVTMGMGHFIDQADTLFSLAPVTGLRLIGVIRSQQDFQCLLDCPHLARLTALDLRSNRIGPAGAEMLAASPHVSRLTELNVGWNHIDDIGTAFLAASPNLSGLNVLYLHNNLIGNRGTQALASSQHIVCPKRLYLSGNSINAHGARALAASTNLAQLTTLELSYNELGPAGAQALGDSPHLARLSTLDVCGNRIGYPGARALLTSPNLPRLNDLDLRGNDLHGVPAEMILPLAELRRILGVA